jgi:outer membrane protein assembly factor BamB
MFRSVKGLQVLAVAGLLAALPSVASAQNVNVLWRAQMATPPPMAWKPREHGGITLSPHGTWLYAASATGLRAYVASTGEELWSAATTERVDSKPVVENGAAYAVTRAGNVYAFDAVTGHALWPEPSRLQAAVQAPLAADASRIYVAADPGAVVALNRLTGKPEWRFNAEVAREFLIEGQSGVLPGGSLVFAGMPGGKLVALGARDGGLTWQVDLSRPSRSPYADVDTTPVLVKRPVVAGDKNSGDWLLAASHSGGLYALRAADGHQIWHCEIEGMGPPMLHNDIDHGDRVYVLAATGTLHVIDLATGVVVQSHKMPGNPSGYLAWSDIGGGTLLVPTEQGLDLVHASTGIAVSRALLEWGFTAVPQVQGDTAFAVSNGGVLYAMALHETKGVWQRQ